MERRDVHRLKREGTATDDVRSGHDESSADTECDVTRNVRKQLPRGSQDESSADTGFWVLHRT